MDARQFPQWGHFLSLIGWNIEKLGKDQIFIRKIPFLGAIIKFQRPENPLPFSQMDQIAKKYHALCLVLEPGKEIDEDTLKSNGFKPALNMSLTHTSTIHIDLTHSGQDLWRSFSENARRNINKARQQNLVIKEIYLKDAVDDSTFKQFFSLLVNLTRIKKFFLPGYSEFYKKMLAFKNSSVIFFAYHPSNLLPIAALWMGYHQKTAVYMHIGITNEGYQRQANYLMVWEAMLLAKKLNLEVFDFEGIFDPRFPTQRKSWQGFSEFKKRFHGKIVEYPAPYIKLYNPFFKLFYLCTEIFSR